MKKAVQFVMLMAVVLAMASTGSATSVASIKGVYAFQMQGVSNQWGYYNGSTWVNLNNSPCPAGKQCFNQSFSKLTYGTISFDGLGHATFLSITNVNSGNGGGGPVKGSIWAYTVSGFGGAIGTASNGAYLTLGDFNTAGVAQNVFIRTADSSPEVGVAILQ
jgi:hypothetical protein